MAYLDCKIEIKDEKSVQLDCAEYGRHVECQINPDPLRMRTIDRFNYWVDNDSRNCDREDLAILGEHLYHLLFDTTVDLKTNLTIRDAFEQIFGLFEDRRKAEPNLHLRLILIFHAEASDLAAYPWEFLYMSWSQESFFLAGQRTELILTRFVPEARINIPPRNEGPLKILIAVSTPRELGEIEAKEIIDEITNLETSGIIVKNMSEPCSFNNLRAEIERFRPDILHFIGHGRPNEIAFVKEADELALEEDLQGKGKVDQAAWVDSTTFNVLFDEHKPRLVFLHACKGAMSDSMKKIRDSLKTFKNTARELVYSQIPAVVAMQYSISNQDASLFAKTFYRKIGEGKYIDEAVAEARRQLGTHSAIRGAWNDRSFGTPVVYLQWQSEIPIITPLKDKEPKPKEEPPIVGKVNCPNPDCNGFVAMNQAICVKCRHALMICPDCRRLMDKDIGLCGYCRYDIKASQELRLPSGPKPEADQIKQPEPTRPPEPTTSWDKS